MSKRYRKLRPTRHAPRPCVNCGKAVDSATGVDHDHKPSPGDVTICLYCHHVMVYGEGLTLREPTDAEIVDMAGEPSLVKAMRALGAFKQWEAKRAAASRRTGERGVVSTEDRSPDKLELP